jgi:hypothetical protein
MDRPGVWVIRAYGSGIGPGNFLIEVSVRYWWIKRLAFVVLILLAGLVQFPAWAQEDGAISEAEYWSRLRRTADWVRQALADEGSTSDAVAQINALWQGVSAVLLPDGTSVPVDTRWLQLSPDVTRARLQELQTRIAALLNYQSQHSGLSVGAGDQLDQLEQVLKDRRFQYERRSTDSSVESRSLSPLSQVLLIVVGILVTVGVLLYLSWALQVQPAVVTEEADEDETPTTSQAAVALADRSEAVQDYRTAIRYLYLACLLALDERGTIHYNAALTNREHLDQLRGQPQLRQQLDAVVSVFDRVWYGFAPVDQALYQGFRRDIEQLRRAGL